MDEPPYDSSLLELPDCTITPHAGAATYEASNKMELTVAQNILDIIQKGKCTYTVNQ